LVGNLVAALKGTNIPVASVATGFPAGQTPLSTRLEEIRLAVAAYVNHWLRARCMSVSLNRMLIAGLVLACVGSGAHEIDIVIPRTAVYVGDWQTVYDEVKAMKEACGPAHLKTILATGELPTYTAVYQASIVCMMAGADFIKTSTGKEPVNATLAVGVVMCRAIRDYLERTGI
jgi:deoxyribose-phosphate aldolase